MSSIAKDFWNDATVYWGTVYNQVNQPVPYDLSKLQALINICASVYKTSKQRQNETVKAFIMAIVEYEDPNASRWIPQLELVMTKNLHAITPAFQNELKSFSNYFMLALNIYQDLMDLATSKKKLAQETIPKVEASMKAEAERKVAKAEAQTRAEFVTTLQAEQLPITPTTAFVKDMKTDMLVLSEALKKPLCIPQPRRGTYLPTQCQYPKAIAQWTAKEKQSFAAILQFIHKNRACFIQQPGAPTSAADYLIWQPQNDVCRAVWQKLHQAMEPKYHYFVMEQYLKLAAQMARQEAAAAAAAPAVEEDPFYKQAWFLVLAAAVGLGGIYYFTRKKEG